MATLKIQCSYCLQYFNIEAGLHKYRMRIGSGNFFCTRKCFGLSKRVEKSLIQEKEDKRLYDIEYRRINKDKLKTQKQQYNSSPQGRAMQKRARQKQKLFHLEYCRTEKYKEWKRKYDQNHLAKKNYGEYWECAILTLQIETEIISYEAKLSKGQLSKSQKRKRKLNNYSRKI